MWASPRGNVFILRTRRASAEYLIGPDIKNQGGMYRPARNALPSIRRHYTESLAQTTDSVKSLFGP